MLKIQVNTAAGNRAVTDGTLPKVLQQVMEKVNPEAAYFGPDGEGRASYVFFDLKDSSDIPVILEPLFQQFEAKVSLTPVMNRDDLQKGLAQLR
jgi:hypothetical protein